MVSESPSLAAIKGTTRPAAAGNRESYRRQTTAIVDSLATVLQNEDILIKTIP